MERAELTRAVREGAMIVDVRPVGAFVACHLAGSVFVALSRRRLPAVLGACVAPATPLVVVTPGGESAGTAAALVASAGYPVLGVVGPDDGDLEALGLPTASLDVLAITDLERRLEGGAKDLTLVDVRERFEWNLGFIEGAVHVPLGELRERSASWDPDQEVACICEEGVRSATAASLLRRRGLRAATVAGGTAAWFESGRPLKEA